MFTNPITAIKLAMIGGSIALLGFMYYNYKQTLNEVEYLKAETDRLVEINKRSADTIELLKKDIEFANNVLQKNNSKKQEINKQASVIKQDITEKISIIADDKQYEEEINRKFEEITKCFVSCQ